MSNPRRITIPDRSMPHCDAAHSRRESEPDAEGNDHCPDSLVSSVQAALLEYEITPPEVIVTLLHYAIANRSAHSVHRLAEQAGCTVKSLERACRAADVPAPKAWLCLADAAKTVFLLSSEPARSSAHLAQVLGYADKFSYFRALRRGTGVGIGAYRAQASIGFAVQAWWEEHSGQRSKRADCAQPESRP
jgi:AraC-like DNA-binding protein